MFLLVYGEIKSPFSGGRGGRRGGESRKAQRFQKEQKSGEKIDQNPKAHQLQVGQEVQAAAWRHPVWFGRNICFVFNDGFMVRVCCV